MMLKAHMDLNEKKLLAISQIPSNTGHPLHKGTPREAFIKEFLQGHLPANLSIGTGEIIDSNSKPGEARNQYDLVIYKSNFPKLDFGGGVTGFLAESVIATIEVKSTLTNVDMEQAVKAARNSKALIRNNHVFVSGGHSPPRILNYVIAYNGPASMQTVCGWLPNIHSSLGIPVSDIPMDARLATPSPSVDGVFVLGKGFVYFDNVEIGFVSDEHRSQMPNIKWCFADSEDGNLLLFFAFLQSAVSNVNQEVMDFMPYIAGLGVKKLGVGVL